MDFVYSGHLTTREQFPDVSEAENPFVWCDRCQREHRKYPMTRADYDRLVHDQAKALADRIDADILARVMRSPR